MTAPTSQKAGVRPISFVLVDGNAGTTVSISLSIRPEDLTRTEPTTATAQRTLGGAWVDNFGPGMDMAATDSDAYHAGLLELG